ncbi:hypothetical protein HK102_005723 [Quaeritorhiza haematococci]|nr:hypothetical protein HK102_005723 [Quaeritorhiza haematococci]
MDRTLLLASNNDQNQTHKWLRQVLTPYQQPDRVFADSDEVLSAFNGLTPKTDTYTHDDGRSLVLLCLHGTIPISFRGNTYNIPVALWIPRNYPMQPPTVFVTPTANMLIRPSKHVDLSGRVYHPFLAYWHTRVESRISQFIKILQDIFAAEPPVYTKPSTPPPTSYQPVSYSSPPSNPSSTPNPTSSSTTYQQPLPPSYMAASSGNNNAYYQQDLMSSTGSLSSSTLSRQGTGAQDPSSTSLSSSPPPPSGSTGRTTLPRASQPLPANPSIPTSTALTSSSNTPSSISTTNASIPQPSLSQQQQQQPQSLPGQSSMIIDRIIATGGDPSDPKRVRLETLRQAVREKLRAAQREFNARTPAEIDALLVANKQLNEGEARIAEVCRQLREEEQKVRQNIEILSVKNRELIELIEALKKEPDINIDEIVHGATVVYNQLSID